MKAGKTLDLNTDFYLTKIYFPSRQHLEHKESKASANERRRIRWWSKRITTRDPRQGTSVHSAVEVSDSSSTETD